jgi:hypothetical protein
LGASGGILVAWNGSHFSGLVTDRQHFAITIEFTSRHTMESWKLTTMYGPCTEPDHSNFITWFSAHQIADDDNWLFWGISISIAHYKIETERVVIYRTLSFSMKLLVSLLW